MDLITSPRWNVWVPLQGLLGQSAPDKTAWTMDIYFLTLLCDRSLTSGCSFESSLLTCRRPFSPHVLKCLMTCRRPFSPHVLLLLKGDRSDRTGPTHMILFYLNEPCLQMQSHSEVPGLRLQHMNFGGGHNLAHNHVPAEWVVVRLGEITFTKVTVNCKALYRMCLLFGHNVFF